MGLAAPRTPEEIRMAQISDSAYEAGWKDAVEECAKLVERMGIGLNGVIVAQGIRKLSDEK